MMKSHGWNFDGPTLLMTITATAVFFVISLIASIESKGTSFVDRPFPDSVKDAPNIVRGQVGMSYAKVASSSDGSERIYTYYELKVSEVFKGNAPSDSLVLREMGGEKDGVGLVVAGAAHFEKGEDVVVLLGDKNPDGSFDVRDMMMGRFSVEKDSDGNEFLRGAALKSHPPVFGENDGEHASPRQKWTLEDLRKLTKGKSASQSPEPSVAVAAPQLQPSTQPAPTLSVSRSNETTETEKTGETRIPIGKWTLFAGIAVGVAIFVVRKTNQK